MRGLCRGGVSQGGEIKNQSDILRSSYWNCLIKMSSFCFQEVKPPLSWIVVIQKMYRVADMFDPQV